MVGVIIGTAWIIYYSAKLGVARTVKLFHNKEKIVRNWVTQKTISQHILNNIHIISLFGMLQWDKGNTTYFATNTPCVTQISKIW